MVELDGEAVAGSLLLLVLLVWVGAVLSAFGYKQLLFEPVVGGGVFTAASVPLVASVGGWPILALVSGLMIFWLVLGIRLFGSGRRITDEA